MKNINSERSIEETVPYTWIADDIREWLNSHTDERALAAAMAFVWNEDALLYDELDCKFGSVDEEIRQNWSDLEEELVDAIATILEKEQNSEIPRIPQLPAIAPFMERNRFYYGSGWWIEEER